MPLGLFALSIGLYTVSAVASLAVSERTGGRIAAIGAVLGALAGMGAAAPVLADGQAVAVTLAGPFPFASFALRLDGLAALMVATIALVSAAAALFGITYAQEEYAGRGVGVMGFFMNLFVAAMMMVAVADNALWFIVFFELMSLASFFLVTFEQDAEAIGAGWLYFVIAHAGSMLVLIAFLLLFAVTGSLDFATFRGAAVPASTASIVFLLALFGFGAKAGMIPLHVWLPRAHPAAPSHASALLSGVMVKIGAFGIIRVGVEFLGARVLWWGLLVLAFGAVSTLLGVAYALMQHDLKRLLAYHTVENIGIILMGIGIGMVGIASGQSSLAVIGFLAALYHLVNHAVFKSLLFLGAGAVITRIGSKDMGRMGGLLRAMPWTAVAFLIGALAICALPPLNGFVSEWFTYQSLFIAALHGSALVRLAAPLSAVMLGIAGALAAMCFVKAFGVTFAGEARSEPAKAATEVSWPMLAGMGLLAASCILLGIGAPIMAPLVGGVASSLVGGSTTAVADGVLVFPGDPAIGELSTPLIAILLIGLAGVPLLITALFAARRPRRRSSAVWACGYLPDAQMHVSAGGFAEPIRVLFRPLYGVRSRAARGLAAAADRFAAVPGGAARAEELWDRLLLAPIGRGVQAAGEQLQVLQGGDFRVYCLYIVAALIVLLAVVTL